MTTVILASQSPRRRELLTQIGVPFEAWPADVDETVHSGEAPESFVRRVALEKARTIAVSCPEAIVLGSDTAVVLGDHIFGKPQDADDAERMLTALSGRTHQVMTAVAIVCPHGERVIVQVSDVSFRTLDGAEIRRYWHTGEPCDKAGAYAVQGLAARFIARLNGSYSGVMGLPLFETCELLAWAGWEGG